jgi:transcriptional regulator GlxA family with amidase domain
MRVAGRPSESQNGHERFVSAIWANKDDAMEAPASPEQAPLHVSIVAIPDAVISTLSGIYDVFTFFGRLAGHSDAVPSIPPFHVEIVGEGVGPVALASGLPIPTHKSIAEVTHSDIVIVPSVVLDEKSEWRRGRYPALTEWIARMDREGAVLCSACSGLFLLAETGLFDGKDATVHWLFAPSFHKAFPGVPIYPERALVVAGERERYVCSGASMSWHDLVLYLIARFVGVTSAQTVAKFYALQWHEDGLAPYIMFNAPTDHGDALILGVQDWISTHFSVATPVEEMERRSGLAERSFKRRFARATGYSPIAYVQRLRIEDAKRRLERTAAPIDEIGWQVGYEDPAFFRRLFKRTVGLTPGDYRRKFQLVGVVNPKGTRVAD